MSDQNNRLRAPGSGLRRTLDQEIDHVAALMVSVEHDAAMADRMVSRLPAREKRGAWFVLLPQAAAAVAILVAVVMWTTRERVAPVAPAPAAPAPVAAMDEAGAKAPALQTSLSEPTMQPVLLPDHERALAPVAAPIPIELAAIETPALLEEPFLVLAPLALTELPLSGESISPY